MKTQVFCLGSTIIHYQWGNTWFDRELRLCESSDGANHVARVCGADQIIALRDFLNSLDLGGRRLALVKATPMS